MSTNEPINAINVYDRELRQIQKLMRIINEKYSKKPLNDRTYNDMITETANRFAEIGFKVALATDEETGFFTFEIISRIERHDFDIEEKIYEVKRAQETEEIVPEL